MVRYSPPVQNFFARGRAGGTGPPNVNLGPPVISKVTRARKLKLNTQLDMIKYSLRIQIFWR